MPQILLLSITILQFTIAVYMFFHKPRTAAKILFMLIALQFGVWACSHYFGEFYFVGNPNGLIWSARISLLSVLFLPSIFALMCSRIVTADKTNFFYFAKWSFIVPVLMLPFAFGDYNAGGFQYDVYEYQFVEIGTLYHFYIPYFLIMFLSGCGYLAVAFFREKTYQARKIQFGLLFSVSIGVSLFGIYNNAILPHYLDIYTEPEIGPISSLILTGTIAYLITRYRLFRIKLGIQKQSAIAVALILFISAAAWSIVQLRFLSLYSAVGLAFLLIAPIGFIKVLQLIDRAFFLDEAFFFKRISDDAKKISITKYVSAFFDESYRTFKASGEYVLSDLYLLQRQYARLFNFFAHRRIRRTVYFKSIYFLALSNHGIILRKDLDTYFFWQRVILRRLFVIHAADVIVQLRDDEGVLGLAFLVHVPGYEPNEEELIEPAAKLSEKYRGVNGMVESLIGAKVMLEENEYEI